MVGFVDVVQQSATLGDHHQQAPTATEILMIDFQMLGQGKDFLGQDSDLDICGTSVFVVPTMGFYCL